MIQLIIIMLPLFILGGGIVFSLYHLKKIVLKEPQPIEDVSLPPFTNDIDKIRSVSKKYSSKIRGSVRLGRGRIKSVDELYELEKTIYFP